MPHVALKKWLGVIKKHDWGEDTVLSFFGQGFSEDLPHHIDGNLIRWRSNLAGEIISTVNTAQDRSTTSL